jgi:hypothetical protein
MAMIRSARIAVRRAVLAALAGACLAVLAAWPPAMAQKPPGPVALEALIKATLLTFNDANITGNYTVFHARLAKPFREQFTPEKLRDVFRSFSDQGIDVEIIAALKPTLTDEPQVDDRGALLLRGYFETSPNRVTFVLDYVQSDGDWKLININVKVKPPGE